MEPSGKLPRAFRTQSNEKTLNASPAILSKCTTFSKFRLTHDDPDNHYFSCKNNRAGNGLCKKTHHVRVGILNYLIKNDISNVVRSDNIFENNPMKTIVNMVTCTIFNSFFM